MQTKGRKLKNQTKRNNGNIFGLFVFWKSENKNENTRERETWIYKDSTNYDKWMSESSAYLPPSLGFWPKWRSISVLIAAPGWWVIIGVIIPRLS
jgi:NADH:ubiquinone oxidoreductase subunit 2 (subunit N)